MNQVIFDSDILSHFFRGNEKIVDRFKTHIYTNEIIFYTIITYYEILNGLLFKDARKQLKIFLDFCELNKMLNLTKTSVYRSAEIFSDLRKKGKTIGHTDTLIAGIALENDMILVTNNTKHFEQIEGLVIEN